MGVGEEGGSTGTTTSGLAVGGGDTSRWTEDDLLVSDVVELDGESAAVDFGLDQKAEA